MRARNAITLALLKAIPTKWDLAANLALFLALAQEARASGADLLLTPECWLDGYASPDPGSSVERLRTVGQAPDSPYLQRVAREARRHRLAVCFGFTSRDGETIRNSAGLWLGDGTLAGLYHKTHLQNHDLQYTAGDRLPVFATPWGPLGIMICADRRWPEVARCLRLQGARLILNPTYGMHGEANECWMRTRAYENQCFIAFAHPKVALVTGPDGGIVAKRDDQPPGLLVCRLDLAQARDNNHLQDRRPELYGAIAAPRPPA